MLVREATTIDRDDIHGINWSAFPESEREIVARLAVDLLGENSTPQTISLVAETDGAVVGHVAFSPVTIVKNESLRGYILAPLAVKPGFQKHGIGSKLVKSGIQQLSRMGVNILFVYGDPEYYGRFGFSAAVAEGFIPPYALQYFFGWQGIVLNEYSSAESAAKIACVASLCDAALW
jgi:putative acetyltransferase